MPQAVFTPAVVIERGIDKEQQGEQPYDAQEEQQLPVSLVLVFPAQYQFAMEGEVDPSHEHEEDDYILNIRRLAVKTVIVNGKSTGSHRSAGMC